MLTDLIDISDPEWSDFVLRHPAATPFHHPAWAAVLSDCYGFPIKGFVVRDGAGSVVAGCPFAQVRSLFGARRWVSLPFTDSCAPLTSSEVPLERLTELLAATAEARGLGPLEVRCPLPSPAAARQLRGVRHVVELADDPDVSMRGLSAMHRRNVKAVARSGVTAHRGASPEDVREYYRLHLMTRRRLGVPAQPRRFFDLIAERMFAEGLGFVITARLEGVPIGGALFLVFNRTLVYKFSASDPDARRNRPTHLVLSEAMRWGSTAGCQWLDLGRADSDAQGLRDFKCGWGAVETPLEYSYIGGETPRPAVDHVNPVARTIISHSPQWVCRAVGEIAYRWAT